MNKKNIYMLMKLYSLNLHCIHFCRNDVLKKKTKNNVIMYNLTFFLKLDENQNENVIFCRKIAFDPEKRRQIMKSNETERRRNIKSNKDTIIKQKSQRYCINYIWHSDAV